MIVFLLALSLIGCSSGSNGGLSDRAAVSLLEEKLREGIVLPLGLIKFVSAPADPDFNRHEIRDAYTSWYDALAADGSVSLSQRIKLTDNRNFSWGNWMELTQRGVRETVVAARTPEGATRHRCAAERLRLLGLDDALCIDQGSGNVEEIVRSEQLFRGTRVFHFFMGNFRWKFSPLLLKVPSPGDENRAEERKFMAIAAYDPFLKKWTLADADVNYAPRSGTFSKQQQFDQVLSTMSSPRVINAFGR